MSEVWELLQLAFVQRAILAGVLVSITASSMGMLVVLRRSSMFGDALAHSSLTGVALGLLLGWQPLVVAAGYAVAIAIALPYFEKRSQLPLESILGFMLPISMALGVLLLSYIPGSQPELISYLFGSILSVGWNEVLTLVALALLALSLKLFFLKPLLFSSFDPEYAQVVGLPVQRIQTFYQIVLALTVVASIQVVGIILVNALVIIPANTARLVARSLTQMLWLTPLFAVVATLVGIGIALWFDLPPGPAITLTSGSGLVLALLLKKTR